LTSNLCNSIEGCRVRDTLAFWSTLLEALEEELQYLPLYLEILVLNKMQ
jgi:hypothetical protein